MSDVSSHDTCTPLRISSLRASSTPPRRRRACSLTSRAKRVARARSPLHFSLLVELVVWATARPLSHCAASILSTDASVYANNGGCQDGLSFTALWRVRRDARVLPRHVEFGGPVSAATSRGRRRTRRIASVGRYRAIEALVGEDRSAGGAVVVGDATLRAPLPLGRGGAMGDRTGRGGRVAREK